MTSLQRKGIAFVLCAPSGTGKTTLVRRLEAVTSNFSFSISYTTRKPRDGEVHGKDYFFVSREDFIEKRDAHFFAEWAEVHGNFYGSPLAQIQELLDAGKDILFDIDVQGAAQLKKNLEHTFCVFVLPPSRDSLFRRLRGRSTDDEPTICKRVKNAQGEIENASWFDAVVVNDDLDIASKELEACYVAATLSPRLANGRLVKLLKEWADG